MVTEVSFIDYFIITMFFRGEFSPAISGATRSDDFTFYIFGLAIIDEFSFFDGYFIAEMDNLFLIVR